MEEPDRPPSATVLFDGVCNLCNAAVRWVVERDPAGRLRFASLQSNAAARVLTEAGGPAVDSLPDSIVLVDDAGVHVRSAAALRIARRLGFPYALLAAGLVLPRSVRDAAYSFVARHRYRWFGRRDTCMRPTPELAARFLDADEPTPVLTSELQVSVPTAPQEQSEGPGWLSSWLVRLAIVYVVVYMAPFPFTLLGMVPVPGMSTVAGWLTTAYGGFFAPLTTWVGDVALGVEATPQPTGSGDRTYNYVQLLVKGGFSLIAATVWSLMARARAVSGRLLDGSRVIARYYLATTMLTYGWVKVFPLQFSVPGPDRLIQSFGDASPMGLAWTFLGASAAYQIFAGASELVAGYLLFWRRTALVGALIAVAVLTNVMAVNYFFDVPVKLFSTHLALVALFIAAPDLPRLVGFLGFGLPTSPRMATPFTTLLTRRRRSVWLAHTLFIVAITGMHVTNNLQAARSYGFLMEPSPLAGVYRVESFERDGLVGRENEDEDRWVRVGLNPPFAATIQRASGDAVRMRMSIDEGSSGMSVYDRGAEEPSPPIFAYDLLDSGLLRLEGHFEGRPTTVLLRPDPEGSLLLERGYHWINDFPFNR